MADTIAFASSPREEEKKTAGSGGKSSRKRTINVQLYNNEHEYSRATMKKMKSKKKGRRFENLCHLLSMFTDDILADDDYDLDDLADFSQNSLFYELFQNDAYLQKWYMFLAKTGEEQDKVLVELDKSKSADVSANDSILDDSYSSEESGKEEETTGGVEFVDLENRLQFGHSAFNKIDKNIKPVLKRQYSLQFLQKYEDQLLPVFRSNQTKEHCIANIENNLERMIVHGLCQYLDINSKSYRNKQGTNLKLIKTNDGKFFIPPILLSEFLQERFFSS